MITYAEKFFKEHPYSRKDIVQGTAIPFTDCVSIENKIPCEYGIVGTECYFCCVNRPSIHAQCWNREVQSELT